MKSKQVAIDVSNLDEILVYVRLYLGQRRYWEAAEMVRSVCRALPDEPGTLALTEAVAEALALEFVDFKGNAESGRELINLYAHSAPKKIRVDKNIEGFSELATNIIAESRSALHFDRLYSIHQAILNVAKLAGPFLELGVYGGGTLKFIAQTCQMHGFDAPVFGLDTFKGHVGVNQASDGPAQIEGLFADEGFEKVAAYVGQLPNVRLVAGDVRETLAGILDQFEQIRFAHIDMDIYAPTAFSLPLLAQKLDRGGILILDDYGFVTCPGAKKATDEFLASRTDFVKFHQLSGQCLLVKI